MAIIDRVRKAWNAFVVMDSHEEVAYTSSVSYATTSPSRPRFRSNNDRSIVTSIYNRISIDVADVAYRHIKLDEKGRYLEDVKSSLNDCLTFRNPEKSG